VLVESGRLGSVLSTILSGLKVHVVTLVGCRYSLAEKSSVWSVRQFAVRGRPRASCRGECSEAKDHVEQLSNVKECIVLFCCSAVVATFCRAATRVCLHDVSLMYLCVESAHGVEGGAAGQHTWHT
jgi:hypothetical protein